jgi:hypothetical protein
MELLNSNQLQWVVRLLKGHCHLNGHLFKMGLTDLFVRRCLEKDESATHILCKYKDLAYLRVCHLGHCFMEPEHYHDPPVRELLHII